MLVTLAVRIGWIDGKKEQIIDGVERVIQLGLHKKKQQRRRKIMLITARKVWVRVRIRLRRMK